VPDEEDDAADAEELAPDPDEREDEQSRLLRDRRLVDEGLRADREPPRERDVEGLVGQVDAEPEPVVRDADDAERDRDGDEPRRSDAQSSGSQPAAPRR
jgi:hypothetical protein